jgi:hypothetical protein
VEELGLTRSTAEENWPGRVNDWTQFSGPLAQFVRDDAGVTSSVSSPILVEGRLWGGLAVHSTRDEPLPAGTEIRVGEFTELIATAISNVQAREDLAASRARIVAAADEERRRVVRDLHDGAQQRLVHTIVTLNMAQSAIEEERKDAAGLVSEAVQRAEEATGELRELAHGILPAVLTRGGLPAGVRALASRMSMPVETDVAVDRLPAEIEATAYFVVAEALTNVAKHAQAEQVSVAAHMTNGQLRIQVADDGVGGADPDGSGFLGLGTGWRCMTGRSGWRAQPRAVPAWWSRSQSASTGTTPEVVRERASSGPTTNRRRRSNIVDRSLCALSSERKTMTNARLSTLPRHTRRALGVGLLIATSLVLAACGGGSSSNNSPRVTAWNLPNANLQNTRNVGGPINRSNVSTLGVSWTVPITASGAFGGYASTPVVEDGVMYSQDINSNVQAIDLDSGEVDWTHNYNSPSVGPNGLSVVNGTVYGATGDSAFALKASNGDQMWIKKLTRNGNEGIDMPPGVHDNTVYVSTVPGNAKAFYAGSGQAVLWALNGATGETKWKWPEVPANLWSDKHTHINSGGGQWYPPTFDGQGHMYVGVANPAPFPGAPGLPWGSSRPARISTPTRS